MLGIAALTDVPLRQRYSPEQAKRLELDRVTSSRRLTR
jgi:hypothetical protein